MSLSCQLTMCICELPGDLLRARELQAHCVRALPAILQVLSAFLPGPSPQTCPLRHPSLLLTNHLET